VQYERYSFEIDLGQCPKCGVELKILAATLDAPVSRRSSSAWVCMRVIELRSCRLHRMPISAARPWAIALEKGPVLAAVYQRRLYFETDRRRGDSLAAWMTGSGRQREYEIAPGS